MEGPLLPEESEGEEPSASDWSLLNERAMWQYEARMRAFEDALLFTGPKRKRRRTLNDYRKKNCEESWGDRNGQGAKADHGLG